MGFKNFLHKNPTKKGRLRARLIKDIRKLN